MRRSLVGAVVLAAVAILMVVGPAAAFPLTDCSLEATALRADGSTIGSVTGGAPDATQEDPFLVDWDGTISYSGGSQIAMKNNSWAIAVFGIPTPLQGGDDNPEDDRDGTGSVGVGENAPFRITGLYFVSGSLTGSGGTCAGSGWLKLTGDPIGTLPFFAALLVTLLGVGMLARGSRGHTVTSIVGGVLAGLGVGVMLVLFSTLPFGSPTPIVTLLLGLLTGVVIALIARRGSRGHDMPPAAALPA